MVFSINTLFSNEQEITKHVIQVVIVKIHVNLRLCKIIQSGGKELADDIEKHGYNIDNTHKQ